MALKFCRRKQRSRFSGRPSLVWCSSYRCRSSELILLKYLVSLKSDDLTISYQLTSTSIKVDVTSGPNSAPQYRVVRMLPSSTNPLWVFNALKPANLFIDEATKVELCIVTNDLSFSLLTKIWAVFICLIFLRQIKVSLSNFVLWCEKNLITATVACLRFRLHNQTSFHRIQRLIKELPP